MTALIKIRDMSKNYLIYDRPIDRLKQMLCKKKAYYREFAALEDVSLEIKRGEAVGIVGRNGSGKSTLLQIICGTLNASAGDVEINGRISALLELGAGFNPEFSGRENIYLNASILGLSRKEIDEKYDDIVAFANIGDHLNQPVKTYSSGMYVRLAFAIAVATDPDILVVDEALAVGDIAFQRKCFARIRQMLERGATILFVSHAMNSIVDLCSRTILLDQGNILMDGKPKDVVASYQRLMFAPEESRSKVRNEIVNNLVLNSDKERFDPSMKPESTVEYESLGAKISNFHITTIEGEQVNSLVRGQRYKYNYEVEFDADFESVRFGMGIKTKDGTILGGFTTQGNESDLVDVKAGDKIEVSFEFSCLLLPATYFTNSGCSGLVDGEMKHLHRVIDAHMFNVKEEVEGSVRGIVDFQITSEINGV